MNIREMIDWLSSFDDDKIEIEVSIVPSSRADKFYKIGGLTLETNFKGNIVVVINLD